MYGDQGNAWWNNMGGPGQQGPRRGNRFGLGGLFGQQGLFNDPKFSFNYGNGQMSMGYDMPEGYQDFAYTGQLQGLGNAMQAYYQGLSPELQKGLPAAMGWGEGPRGSLIQKLMGLGGRRGRRAGKPKPQLPASMGLGAGGVDATNFSPATELLYQMGAQAGFNNPLAAIYGGMLS